MLYEFGMLACSHGAAPTSVRLCLHRHPSVQELVGVHVAGVGKLLANGVTGRIMVGDLPSPKDVPVRQHRDGQAFQYFAWVYGSTALCVFVDLAERTRPPRASKGH